MIVYQYLYTDGYSFLELNVLKVSVFLYSVYQYLYTDGYSFLELNVLKVSVFFFFRICVLPSRLVHVCNFLKKNLSKYDWPVDCYYCVCSRYGSLSKMCRLAGCPCKTIPILGLWVLVRPNQTWTFPVNEIAMKVPKAQKYWIKVCIFFEFVVCLYELTSEVEVIKCFNLFMQT